MLTFAKLMERKELTALLVAAALEVKGQKVSVMTVKKWELGMFKPSIDYIPVLCEVLGVTPYELIGACGASVEERKAQERARVAVA